MNRVKTAHRTSLKHDTLNDLMLISTDGREVNQYSPDQAVEYWFFSAKGTRHLDHKTPVRQRVEKQDNQATLLEEVASSESDSYESDSDF